MNLQNGEQAIDDEETFPQTPPGTPKTTKTFTLLTNRHLEKEDFDEIAAIKNMVRSVTGKFHKVSMNEELKENYVDELEALRLEIKKSKERERQLANKLDKLKVAYNEEVRLRRQIHDELMAIKGNIRVFLRVRPFQSSNFCEDERAIQILDESTILHISQNKKFEFDACINDRMNNETIFKSFVAPFVVSFMDGRNATLIAYGQTGSGKTFTMEGTEKDNGMYLRAIQLAFELSMKNGLEVPSFQVSILQVYNESLQDLLQEDSKHNLEIHQHPDGRNYVKNLTKVLVHSVDQVKTCLKTASKRRAIGGHALNDQSSRSHLIFFLEYNAKVKLVLVDLAGSERLNRTDPKGDRLKESQAINKSLSALGDVLQSLKNKNNYHHPFRNTKLTFLLQDSLLGNSKVAFFACVSPEAEFSQETFCTLSFAERIRKVELSFASLRTSATVPSSTNTLALLTKT